MKWQDILNIAKKQPVIETFMLAQGSKELSKIRVQLSRWVKSGRLIQVKRGAYVLNEEHAFQPVDWNYVSTFVHRPSYISLHYALADYGLIPERVPNITLVTTKRPVTIELDKKRLIYQHIKKNLFWGYEIRGEKNFPVFFTEPEKALLDLFYFTPGKINESFFEGMRFQNTEILNMDKLAKYAERFESPKILATAKKFVKYLEKETEWENL